MDAGRSTPAHQFVIVLPVYNGGRYLMQCVTSILSQTYENFRLIVLDNASTDDAAQWLRNQSDRRICIFASTLPLSIEENWARILHIDAADEYMTIIGHDDLLDSEYLENMCRLIDAHPQAGLYQAHFRLIGVEGRTIRACLPMPERETAAEFLRARMALGRDSFGTGYMYRAENYKRVGGIPLYKNLVFADDALWLALMRDRYKATCKEKLFSYRAHGASTAASSNWRPTFEALSSYLTFLHAHAAKDRDLKTSLDQSISGFMEFWFRWAYFSSAQNGMERAAVLEGIEDISKVVAPMLVDAHVHTFNRLVEAALFERAPKLRWLAWRVRRHLRTRMLAR
jgi:glycosyltransferase involved in cell wall biosynthesis